MRHVKQIHAHHENEANLQRLAQFARLKHPLIALHILFELTGK